MPRDGPMFTSLRGKSQRPMSSTTSDVGRTNNLTNANSILLSAGNLTVGSNQNPRQHGNQRIDISRGAGTSALENPSTSKVISSKAAALNESSKPTPRTTVCDREKASLRPLELVYHEQRYSSDLVMLNLSDIPEISDDDICELRTYHKVPGIHARKIYFVAKDFDSETKKRLKSPQVSVLSGQLQSLLDLPARSRVWVRLRQKTKCEADLIELNVKDCLLNRGDMWCLSSQLVGSCLFSGQRLTFLSSIRATVRGIYREGKKILSAYIGENTRIVFRSESARLIFLIQITDEMWDFEESGEQLFQKMVNSFFPKIFKRWKDIDTHHSITIAFASSVDLSDVPFRELKPGEILKNTTDYFRIVVDQVHVIHWVEIMETLRREFMKLTKDILNVKTEERHSVIQGRFSPVIKSNILELVNFATTILTDPFRQPDLRHTTTHVIIISPGSGLYDVDYDLLKLTGKKLLSLEMNMDLVCLSRAPLHVVPLFRYLDYDRRLHHCCPTWLSTFYWNDSSEGWHPRCKIYDLQMMGLTENDVMQEVHVEGLHVKKDVKTIKQLMEKYDKSVFQCIPPKEDKTNGLSMRASDRKQLEPQEKQRALTRFDWNAPKVADAVIEDVQKTKVLASLYTVGDKSTADTEESFNSLSPLGTAMDTLKGITRKTSVKDFTHKIVNRLMPGRDRERDQAREGNSSQQSATTVMDATLFKGKISGQESVPSTSKSSGGSPTIVKTLDALNQGDRHNTKSPLHGNSIRESVGTINSQKQNDSRVQLMNDKKPNSGSKSSDDDFVESANVNWIEVENPSVPVTNELVGQTLPPRWNDVLPRYVAKKYSKWRSFTTPADLPITISSFPSKNDFENNFIFRNHSVILNPDQESSVRNYKHLLRDLVYMRLVTGFQICVGKQVKLIELSKNQDNKEKPIAKYIRDDWTSVKIYMMIDSEIHRLSCGLDGVIDVQRYIRKFEENPYEQVPTYIPLVKTRYETTYRDAELDPLHATRSSFNWNQIDQVIAGYGDCGFDKKSYGFRSKLVVLPADIPSNTFSSVINGRSETLTPEEIRLEGLRRLISSINRTKQQTPKEKISPSGKREEIQQEITFYTGSLFDFINEQKESLKRSALDYKDSIFADDKMQQDRSHLKKDVDLKTLSQKMQQGSNPLPLFNRKWHWKRHQNSFIGAEMVNWLITNFADIYTREEAVDYGQNLMEDGLFVHVLNKHGFLDGHYFYQLSPQYVISPKRVEKVASDDKSSNAGKRVKKGDAVSISSENNAGGLSVVFSRTNSYVSQDSVSGVKDSKESKKKPIVMLSSSVVIDVDVASKSYKPEICTVHYDKVHNPDHCFHIRLEWLTTTPKLLDDLVGNWSRLCERYGLRLIEIPWKELCAIPSINPFHSFVDIKLAINPWEDPEFRDIEVLETSKFYYHMYLLKASGFLLDNRASAFLQQTECEFEIVYSWGTPEFKYAQYIHNTGAYIAEIRSNGNLFLAPNNIYISRVNHGNVVGKSQSSPQYAIDAQRVMLNFRKTCTDYEKLRTILLEGKENWFKDQLYDEL